MMLLSVVGIERSLCSNKGITRTSTAAALLSFFEFEQAFAHCSGFSNVVFEQLNAGWVIDMK